MPHARNPRRIDAPVPQQHRGALELEAIAVQHTGVAVGVYRMNFPILSFFHSTICCFITLLCPNWQ